MLLYVYGDILRRGGMETHMMIFFRYADKEKVHIDFVVQSQNESGGCYDEEIRSTGSEIFVLPKYHRNPIGYMWKLRKLFRSGRYQVVHSHCDAMNYRVLKLAKQCGVPVRVAHSHNTQHILHSTLKWYYYEQNRIHQSKLATERWACSEEAGRWLFGENSFRVVHNAIDSDLFAFDAAVRRRMREKYGLGEGDIVLGHVGRFDYQKNQRFLLALLQRLNDPKYKLLLVGEGRMHSQVEELTREMGLEQQVIFAGEVPDPQSYYQMMDIFLLPSHFEGLGIAVLEAQANGLPCVVSDMVPKEADIIGSVTYCGLDTDKWAEIVGEQEGKRCENAAKRIEECGYNIRVVGKEISERYVELVEQWEEQK